MSHPFIPAPLTAKVQVIYSQAAGQIENQYHLLRGDSTWRESDLETVIDVFMEWLETYWSAVAVASAQVVKVIATDVATESSYQVERTPPSAIAGQFGGQGFPRNVTCAMKWITGMSGRSFRGRTFHVGLPVQYASTANNNLLAVDGRNGLIAMYNQLLTLTDTILGTRSLCVVSYMTDGDWRAEAVSTLISDVTTDFRIDTQRRRMNPRF